MKGVAAVFERDQLDNPNSGELILLAEKGAWFAYPWWEAPQEAPDYANHVDIHNKIGFDPCELFWGRLLPPGITTDAARVQGTHGRIDKPVCFATDLEFAQPPADLLELSQEFQRVLGRDRG
jgi:hypothetical protein